MTKLILTRADPKYHHVFTEFQVIWSNLIYVISGVPHGSPLISSFPVTSEIPTRRPRPRIPADCWGWPAAAGSCAPWTLEPEPVRNSQKARKWSKNSTVDPLLEDVISWQLERIQLYSSSLYYNYSVFPCFSMFFLSIPFLETTSVLRHQVTFRPFPALASPGSIRKRNHRWKANTTRRRASQLSSTGIQKITISNWKSSNDLADWTSRSVMFFNELESNTGPEAPKIAIQKPAIPGKMDPRQTRCCSPALVASHACSRTVTNWSWSVFNIPVMLPDWKSLGGFRNPCRG